MPPGGGSHEHEDGRTCHVAPYWVGNLRDGHWDVGYWYDNRDGTWRWCGRPHPSSS
jgi:hypothetical protein